MKPVRVLSAIAFFFLLAACQPQAGTEAGKAAATEPAVQPTPECTVTPLTEPVACTMDWNPVCGCDKKTYSNACMAKAAGVSHFEPGECGNGKIR